MSLIAKIMSAENAADEDSRKAHRLITGIVEVEFDRDPTPRITFYRQGEDPFSIDLTGNVYVMNENGRTISQYGCAPLDPPAFDHTIFINGRPVSDIRVDGPVSASLLRELVGVPSPQALARIGDEGFDLIGEQGMHFVKNGDRFLTDLAATTG